MSDRLTRELERWRRGENVLTSEECFPHDFLLTKYGFRGV